MGVSLWYRLIEGSTKGVNKRRRQHFKTRYLLHMNCSFHLSIFNIHLPYSNLNNPFLSCIIRVKIL
jgi:hypothetical protein